MVNKRTNKKNLWYNCVANQSGLHSTKKLADKQYKMLYLYNTRPGTDPKATWISVQWPSTGWENKCCKKVNKKIDCPYLQLEGLYKHNYGTLSSSTPPIPLPDLCLSVTGMNKYRYEK